MPDLAHSSPGRQLIVTDAEILEAGRRIQADGKPITGYSLRKAVGDRGTHRKLMETWIRHVTPAEPPSPPAYAEAIQVLRGDLISQATDAAEALLDRAWRAVAEAADTRAADEVARLRADVADRDQAILDLEASLEVADQARADLTGERDGISAELASVRGELDAAERQAGRDAIRVRDLDESLRMARADLATAQKAQTEAATTAQVVTRERDRVIEERDVERAGRREDAEVISGLHHDAGQARAKLAAAEATMQAARDELTRVLGERASDRLALDKLQADLAKALAGQAALEADARLARDETDRIRGQLTTERADHDALVARAVAAEAEFRHLQAASTTRDEQMAA